MKKTETLGLAESDYHVWTRSDDGLPPVVLSIHTRGPMGFQEYFTPKEAERLAGLLVEAARLARDDEFARTAP